VERRLGSILEARVRDWWGCQCIGEHEARNPNEGVVRLQMLRWRAVTVGTIGASRPRRKRRRISKESTRTVRGGTRLLSGGLQVPAKVLCRCRFVVGRGWQPSSMTQEATNHLTPSRMRTSVTTSRNRATRTTDRHRAGRGRSG